MDERLIQPPYRELPEASRSAGGASPCYWPVRKSGMAVTEVAKLLDMTQAAMSKAVQHGAKLTVETTFDFSGTSRIL